MNLRPCQCGATPKISEWADGATKVLQLACKCGQHGCAIMYTKSEDRMRCAQAAVDGWNMADVPQKTV